MNWIKILKLIVEILPKILEQLGKPQMRKGKEADDRKMARVVSVELRKVLDEIGESSGYGGAGY